MRVLSFRSLFLGSLRSLALLIFCLVRAGFAHEAHKKGEDKSLALSQQSEQENRLKEINVAYLKEVKPIFRAKCFDCHSSFTRYPWYYSFPFVKVQIDNDIVEAKKHLDFSNDFPFQGHGTPFEDLDALAKSIQTGSMPPLKYRLLHFNAKITPQESTTILEWILRSQRILSE